MVTNSKEAMHAGQAVVNALVQEGVEKVFCLPGSHILQMYDALRDTPSIQLVTCKSESNISLFADAYGRVTRKPGVCLLTAGPGASNSLAGVAQAYGAASPVIHITGSVPLNATREAFHGVDDPEFTVEMYKRVSKWSVRLQSIEEIPEVMAKAFHIAQSGRPGPVHIEIPRGSDYAPFMLQRDPVVLKPYQSQPAAVVPPNEEDVNYFAERLLAAKAPVICAGKGVIRKNAMAELAEIAELLSIPVVYPQDAMGVIPDDHPFAAGHYIARRSDPRYKKVMAEADLVFSVGLRAHTAEADHLDEAAPNDRMLVGFDDREDEHYTRKDEIVADPKQFLSALLERVRGEERPANEALKKMLAETRAEFREAAKKFLDGSRSLKPINSGYIVETIASLLKPDSIVVSDVGNCQMWARYYLPYKNPESFMQSGVWNAMSFALPTAIVAKMEFPERDVIGIAGDGAALMTIADFVSAVEYGANFVYVIFNDGAYSQMIGQQENLYGKAYGCEFKSPNFAEIAEACGGLGIRVEEPEDLPGALKRALAADVPSIVDVTTAYYELPPLF